MTRAAATRLAITLAMMAGAVVLFATVQPTWLGITLGVGAFILGSLLADRAFRRLSSEAEIRADLEERTRHGLD